MMEESSCQAGGAMMILASCAVCFKWLLSFQRRYLVAIFLKAANLPELSLLLTIKHAREREQ